MPSGWRTGSIRASGVNGRPWSRPSRGSFGTHQRFPLRQHLHLIATLEETIAALEGEIARALAPFRGAVARLVTIPGIGDTAAAVLVAEIGTDMTRFPTAGHLVSWAGLCPRMDESAGKHRSRRTRKGAPWLKPVLVQAAWSAVRVRDTYLRAQYLRLRTRTGAKKAIVAVAASLLTAAYHMLRTDQDYRDLGPHHLTEADRRRMAHRLTRRLQQLGYTVDVRPAA